MGIDFASIMACHPENKDVFDRLLFQLLDDKVNTIPFVGAGLSKPVYPLWKEYLHKLAEKCGAGHSKEVDQLLDNGNFEVAASYVFSQLGKKRFIRLTEGEFDPSKSSWDNISESSKILPELFQGSVVTTNLDAVLQSTVYHNKLCDFKGVCVPRTAQDNTIIDRISKRNDHYLVKLHGDIDNPSTWVLTEQEYEEVYNKKKSQFYKLLKKLFQQCNFIFLGCGLENDRTLKVLLELVSEGDFFNFAIMSLPKQTSTGNPTVSQINDPFTNNHWMELAEKEKRLSDLMIETIWYPFDMHESVAVILKKLLEEIRKVKKTNNPSENQKFKHARDYFIGRSDFVNKILEDIKPNQVCNIHGAPGIGKTEACLDILNRQFAKGWDCHYVKLQGREGASGFVRAICEEFEIEEILDADAIINAVGDKTSDRTHLLYLDNFEDVLYKRETCVPVRDDDSLDLLLKLKKIPNLSIILSCREFLSGVGTNFEVPTLLIDDAMSLFTDAWNGDRSSLEQNERELKYFLETKLARHPLSIVLAASQGFYSRSVTRLVEDWSIVKEFELDTAENSKHTSFNRAIAATYQIIRGNTTCKKIWALNFFVSSGLSAEQYVTILDVSKSEALQALRLMQKLNILQLESTGYYMLPALQNQIFNYMDLDEFDYYSYTIGKLKSYYGDILKEADKDQTNKKANLRVVSFIDDILNFLEILLDQDRANEVKGFLLELSYYYQFKAYHSADFLERVLKLKSLGKKERANTVLYLGIMQTRLGKVDKALELYEQAEALFKTNHDDGGLADTYQNLGEVLNRIGNVSQALVQYKKAEEISRKRNYNLGLANALQSIADIHSCADEVDEAIRFYSEAKEIYKTEKENLGLANILRSMGDLFVRIDKKDQAMDLFKQAEELFIEEKVNIGLANTLLSIGDLQTQCMFDEQAMETFNKAAELFRIEKDNLGLANTIKCMGDLYYYMGDLEKALNLCNQAEALFKVEKHNLGLANARRTKGDLLARLDKRMEAMEAYNSALTIYDLENNNRGIANTLLRMGDLAAQESEYMQALEYFDRARTYFNKINDMSGVADTYLGEGRIISHTDTIKALDLFSSAESLYRLISNQSKLAETMKYIGDQNQRLGKKEQALNYYDQAETIFKNEEDETAVAYILQAKGDVYCSNSEFESSIEMYLRASSIYRMTDLHLDLADTLLRIANQYKYLDEADRALETYNEAIILSEKHDKTKLSLANCLLNKAELLSKLGDDEEAMVLLKRAKKLFCDKNDKLGTALTLKNIGDIMNTVGAPEDAIANYKQAEDLFRIVKSNAGLAKTLRRLGEIFRRIGRINEALDALGQAEMLFKEMNDDNGRAKSLKNIGDIRAQRNEYDLAIECFIEAERIFRTTNDDIGLAATLRSLGDVRRTLGEVSTAEECYNEAEALYRRVKNNLGLAYTLLSKADMASHLSNHDSAMELFTQAENLFRVENDKTGLANTLERLGGLFACLNDHNKAIEMLKEAGELYLAEKDHLGQANTLETLGSVLQEKGELKKAKQYYERALTLYRSEYNPSGISYCLGELCKVCAKLHDQDAVTEYSTEVLSLLPTLTPKVSRYVGKCVTEANVIISTWK